MTELEVITPGGGAVEFFGESFRLRSKVSQYALLKFARAARNGGDADTPEGMGALLDLLEKCIAPEDWARFDRTADENDADVPAIMDVIRQAFSQEAERPTSRPSDSSAGPTTTPPKSVASYDDKVSILPVGRPDLALSHSRTTLSA